MSPVSPSLEAGGCDPITDVAGVTVEPIISIALRWAGAASSLTGRSSK